MESNEVLATYIKKLRHPLKEIRERSLQLLIAKLQLGWELNDELVLNREILEALLDWFNVHQPSMQQESLELLLKMIKTSGGSYAVREYGVQTLIEKLHSIKSKLKDNALEVYCDIIETVKFLHTVESHEDVNVPRLDIPSSRSSENGGYFQDFLQNTDKQLAEDHNDASKNSMNEYKIKQSKGFNVFLFPWVELSPSDFKTIVLIEDSLKLVKSTRRCCRFIRDVFLCDFPPEIFLNRPSIVKALLSISDSQFGSSPGEALNVLLCITKALNKRLKQLFSSDLVCESMKANHDNRESYDGVNAELEQIVGKTNTPIEDTLAALRQLPAPIYALDTAHAVLCIMMKSVTHIDSENKESLAMKDLNTCLSLIEALVEFLLECVDENFWISDHNSKTQRDIAHKSCMTMRMLGDLLLKYQSSYQLDPERIQHRLAQFRLINCAVMLLNWARKSALPPTSLLASLQNGLLDPGIDIFYPELNEKIAAVLQNAKSSVDQEFKSKYRELNKLFNSMDHAKEFIKLNSTRYNKDILNCIKKSLPILQIHTNENFLYDISNIIVSKGKDLNFDESDWAEARSIALYLMAHTIDWVRVTYYKILANMVKSVLMSDEPNGSNEEKKLTLLSDVSVLTEICCHALSSTNRQVEESASEIMLYLLRGRLVLSESCWWRLLASLLPVLPLLHVYAAHDTQLGKAICKSLEVDIAECMGVSAAETVWGLVRLLFVKCPAVQLDAAHSLCDILDDDKYLPPKETLRTDILVNALRRVEVQDFNVDYNSSPTKMTQTTGLIQVLDVLKQDLVLDEDGFDFVADSRMTHPTLEPSLRRSTLQQLAVMMRQQDLHDAFIRYDGLKLIVALLRMSLTVEDYLAFPECALSCVSIINSVCFVARHSLSKMSDLPLFLIRAILVFPANDSNVAMSAQVLALLSWAGFVLQELDAARRRVPALPLSVTERTSVPFAVNSYWHTSPNAEHASVEWLLTDPTWRSSIRVRWWWVLSGGNASRGSPHLAQPRDAQPSIQDLEMLRSACVDYSCAKGLMRLENATTHMQVKEALYLLEGYAHLMTSSTVCPKEFGNLKWQNMRRFLSAPPASARDTDLLLSLLHFIITYMDHVPKDDTTMSWIKSSFIGNEATIISLLSRDRLYPQQSSVEDIEVTQLRIQIVKVLLRCLLLLEESQDYSSSQLESLLKILLSCLERVDLKNFHMLGYLNELMRCIRYGLHSRYCDISEETLIYSLKMMSRVLSGCASGGGRKGRACRLDAMLALMVVLKKVREQKIPVQRWGEHCDGSLMRAAVRCGGAPAPELRAAALHVMAAFALYAQLTPQLLQYIPNESLCRFAIEVFSQSGEANVVRAAALLLLTAVTSRVSPMNQLLEQETLQTFEDYNFVEECLQVLIDFCHESSFKDKNVLEPNMPLTLLERRTELEVRAQKHQDVQLSPTYTFQKPPPTADIVTAIADVFTNVITFKNCPIQAWNELGLFRVMFRCLCWSSGSRAQVHGVRGSVCRSLYAATTHKCVRAVLASTKDCLYNLISTLTPFDLAENEGGVFAQTQAMILLGSLIVDRSASDTLWCELKKNEASDMFNMLLQSLESDDNELQAAAIFCLTQLAQSISCKDKSKQESCKAFLDNIKSPKDPPEDVLCAGDTIRNADCQPEYIVEELCKVLMELYKEQLEEKRFLECQDETWSAVCSCISSVLSASARARQYAAHRQFPRLLVVTMQAFRDRLSLQGKPVDVIRNANNEPVLHNLYWLLTLMNCAMLNCPASKESFAEDNICVSLNKLWPWCMMTEQLRDALIHLLLTFTNDCPKAWSNMCTCVCGRSAVGALCELAARDAARPRAPALLPPLLRVLTRCAPHQHCRTLVLKSDVLSCVARSRARACSAAATGAWARLCEALGARADGAAALLAACARAPPPCLLPALAHAAHHHRLPFLQSR
ncbi:rotatin-like [Zerene cesonia]|uniref:rotatin-like n=1 Tax=Zerene cesonia TaxID=33412 RepID=UPI0018E5452D|nr:rotatin-like [Zerene cesonia]